MAARLRVLVVDDDRDMRELIQLVLALEGYAVEQAADGDAALDLIRQDPPGLVLLDLRLPGTDGWAFARACRELAPPTPPIVLLTAAVDARRRFPVAEASGYLDKPFDVEDLLAVVRRFAGPADG